MGDLFKLAGIKKQTVCGIKGSRFITPIDEGDLPEMRIKYKYAQNLADDLGDIPLGFRADVILDGSFIFGDFIEALIVKNNWNVIDLTISTLSFSFENIYSLKNLLTGDYVQELNIIVSGGFFAKENHPTMIIPAIYEELDIDDKFQLAVADVHTKIVLIKTECGRKIVIHGSSNLRTSANIEHICIENKPELHDFYSEFHQRIIEKYKTIRKGLRGGTLWREVLGEIEIKEKQNKKPAFTRRVKLGV